MSATELHQFLKFPILLEHYQDHKTLKPNLSFLDYLFNHYLNENQNSGHKEKDQQLPFKSYEDCAGLSILAHLPVQPKELTPKPNCVYSNSIVTFNEESLISSYLANIWQPPKSI